jgi:hypothetical protein
LIVSTSDNARPLESTVSVRAAVVGASHPVVGRVKIAAGTPMTTMFDVEDFAVTIRMSPLVSP